MLLKLTREPNEKKLIEEKQKIAAIKTFPVKTHIGLIFLLKVLVPFNYSALAPVLQTTVQSKVNSKHPAGWLVKLSSPMTRS